MKGRSALATMFACALITHVTIASAQKNKGKAKEEEVEEEEGTSEEEGTTEEAAPEEGAEAEPEEGAEAAPEEGAEAPAAGRWPRAVIARPLTLPKSLIRLGADITPNKDFKVIGLALTGGYGVSDDLEVNVNYGLALKTFEAKGALTANVGYKVLRGAAGGKLEVIGRGTAGYSLLAKNPTPIVVGAQVQYNISDKLAVVSNGNNLSIALADAIVPPATTGVKPISLFLPVGVGYQATPELYVELDTQIAQIKVSNSANAFIFADTTPLLVTGTYNVKPALDVTAGLSLDVTPPVGGAGDTLAFLIGARYYMGAL
jgi:hypothetical protein